MCQNCQHKQNCSQLIVQGYDCFNQPMGKGTDNITDYSNDNGAYIEAPRFDSKGVPVCAKYIDRTICPYCGRINCMMETGGTSCG